jgi:hypothetical protein
VKILLRLGWIDPVWMRMMPYSSPSRYLKAAGRAGYRTARRMKKSLWLAKPLTVVITKPAS